MLIQAPSRDGAVRTWTESPTIGGAMEGLVLMFEAQLGPPPTHSSSSSSSMQDGAASSTYRYDIEDLYHFIDRLPDLACLCYAEQLKAYEPHDKTWIKRQLYNHLKSVG